MADEHLPVNIGNPHEMTILQFAEEINRITGNTGGIVHKMDLRLGDDPQRRQPDITKAKSILNWEPKVDLQTGLASTINYFRSKLGQ
jgi:dTDP-glucose 4,6-dehydratase